MSMDAKKETSAFSQWLGQHRKSIDLTQQELAQLVGYSLETIKKIEEGTRRPSRQIAERLAQSLNIPPEEHPEFIRFARNELLAEAQATLAGASHHPPWRLLRPPNNLPAHPTAFIGRGEVVSHVVAFLRRPGVRLLTLTGPPGIGKTRLSLEVARQTLSNFVDGTFFVALAPVLDANLVATTMSQTLGIQQLSNQPVMEKLKSYLQEKQMLLVIDNFEHVVAAAPQVAELLSAAPGLKVLSSSRTLLQIYGEYSFQVPPMTVPGTGQQLSATQLAEYEAVMLFTERAIASSSDFEVTDDNAIVLALICAGLDGLPLALELAAARTRLLPLETILGQLTSRLDLLVDGPRDMTARQQTLRGAVAWSYDLLSGEEQILFRRLSVFRGGCSIEAVEAVCNADGKLDSVTGQLLRSLANMSLLQHIASANGEIRYTMLETIRQYASEILDSTGGNEAQATHDRHALYFVDLAEQAEAELRGPEQIAWFKLVEIEHDNIRAALKWILEHMHVDVAGKLAAALWRFWYIYGHATEGRQWLEATLQKDDVEGLALEASVRADVLNAVGVLTRHQGDYSSAASYYRHSLALSRDLQDVRRIARALTNLSNVIRYQGHYHDAEQLLEESLEISREVGDKESLAATLNMLGVTARHIGEPERAATLCEQSLALYREIGDKVGIASALSNLGTIAQALGDYMQAGTYFAEGLTIFREVGDKPGQSVALTNLGFGALHAHDYVAAASFYRGSLDIRRQIGNNSGTAYALNDLGIVEQKQGNYEKAERYYAESLLLFSGAGDSRGIAECLERVAGVAAARKESRWAAQLLGAAEALRNATGTLIEPEDRADYDNNVQLVREQLGEEVLTAWQEGQMQPVESFITSILAKYDYIQQKRQD